MNLGRADEALRFVRAIRPRLSRIHGADVVLCPPFTALAAVSEVLRRSPIMVGAQNAHWERAGAHTGEISPEMLAEMCQSLIVGHSERRATESILEGDAAIRRKVGAALAAGLVPIVCVGEDSTQHERGETDRVVGGQVEAAFTGIAADAASRCVVAYEPVWAIGSGRAATPAAASRVMGLTVRGRLADLLGERTARSIRVLYGGSVTAANIADFMAMPEIDGALVGGASLDATGFVELVRNAAAAA
jgi:triosephosphate isomerase